MNLNPRAVFALLGGIVLLYSAVKNMYPQDVIRKALGKEPLKGPIYTGGKTSVLSPDLKPSSTLTPSTGVPVVSV